MLMKSRCVFYLALAGAVLLGAGGIMFVVGGCESTSDDDSTGAEGYFNANPYVSETRSEESTTLEISPASASIGNVGQQVAFTASGGTGSYYWAVAFAEYGDLTSSGANQCIYTCKRVCNNTLTVQDDGGHYATAQITTTNTMSITPTTVTLSGGARYVGFTVSGGTSPYIWMVGNSALGTISYSSAATYTAGYTASAGVYGQNTITVEDADGHVATATVIQSQ